ncbi:MAG: N-acetylmuramoyl-L-alanine amidase [Candidatus Acidiferrales bacterium]
MLILGFIVTLAGLFAPPARGDLKAEARQQFEQAVKLRTMLEGYLEKDRSLTNYKETVLAYHKVYMITPRAEDATQALTAEAELYEEMGRLFDPKYFESAIEKYNFLLQQYPGTRYRAEALFAIGQIQKDDLSKLDDAEATFKQFLKHYPRSDKASAAQQALKEIAGLSAGASTPATASGGNPEPVKSASLGTAPDNPGRMKRSQPAVSEAERVQTGRKQPAVNGWPQAEKVSETQPDLKGQAVEPRISNRPTPPIVENVQTWNSPDSTRIIVTLSDTIKYDAALISSPDRIYFNLYKAWISPKLAHKSLDVDDGLLKSVRIAQNKPDVVRLVLNLNGDKNYSTFLLANPYRLVIDVHSHAVTMAKSTPDSAAPAAALTPSVAEPARSTGATAPVTSTVADAAVPPVDIMAAHPTPADAKTVTKIAQLKTKAGTKTTAALVPPPEAQPTHDGDRSLTRALGLKISRIVIDPGHGGHDTGTIGPHGLMEKDLCLDVALRLGSLIEEKLPGADVIYTRKDDTYVSLEERTAIANEAHADLFISIHANSSPSAGARGVETYYLNFATTKDAMDVASRENALSQEPLHNLQELIKKIARNDKIEESKEFASDIQDALTQRLQLVSRSEKNRGVKKAPFIVLIGANMPSVLAEVSFISNPYDERLLRKGAQRERIADGLYRGIRAYLASLNSISNNQQKLASDDPLSAGTVASNGNPK